MTDLERLRKLIVYVDTCLEKGELVKLNDELNRQVKYILSEEDVKEGTYAWDKIVDMDFSGFMEKRKQPRFGMYDPPPVETPRTNARFEHLKNQRDANNNRANKEFGES